MEIVNNIDLGGQKIEWYNIIDKDVIGYLKDMNMSLGTSKDERYEDLSEFLKELEEEKVEFISAASINMSNNEIANLDIDDDDVGNKILTLGDFILAAGNIAKSILSSQPKPTTIFEAKERKDKNGMVWGVFKADIGMVSKEYNIKKKEKKK